MATKRRIKMGKKTVIVTVKRESTNEIEC